jgi:CheY-like chemotaxis protein
MCASCIALQTGLTESATRTALEVLLRAVDIQCVVTDRCHGCGHVAIVYFIPHPNPASDARGLVLIVEDHPDTREMYEAFLTAAGFACRTAATPTDALQQIADQRVDVAVVDLGLPRIEDGLALARRLQELPQAPPLIALTGYAESRLPKGVFRAYLMKPFDPDALVATVTRVLGV